MFVSILDYIFPRKCGITCCNQVTEITLYSYLIKYSFYLINIPSELSQTYKKIYVEKVFSTICRFFFLLIVGSKSQNLGHLRRNSAGILYF